MGENSIQSNWISHIFKPDNGHCLANRPSVPQLRLFRYRYTTYTYSRLALPFHIRRWAIRFKEEVLLSGQPGFKNLSQSVNTKKYNKCHKLILKNGRKYLKLTQITYFGIEKLCSCHQFLVLHSLIEALLRIWLAIKFLLLSKNINKKGPSGFK